LRKNYLAIRLDYNTGGQDITLKSADFILIDKQEKKYLCVGFAGMSFVLSEGESSYVETDAVHSEISVMSEEWGSFPLIILFDGVNSNIGTLKLRYRGSKNFIRIRL
jgi:archaellin